MNEQSTVTIDTITAEFIEGKLSFADALKKWADHQKPTTKNDDKHVLSTMYLGANVFIRTVTHHYTGKVFAVSDGFIVLSYASWIPDDGRFHECIAKGTVKECEPYPDSVPVCISIGSIIDICRWGHLLPRTAK